MDKIRQMLHDLSTQRGAFRWSAQVILVMNLAYWFVTLELFGAMMRSPALNVT